MSTPDQTKHQLYQKTMLAHHKNPIGFGKIICVSHSAQGDNPMCGDEISVEISMSNDIIEDMAFHGDSCAICRASASIMCEQLVGMKYLDGVVLSNQLMSMLNNNITMTEEHLHHFEPLNTVKKFPIRKQCALLPWSTFQLALSK